MRRRAKPHLVGQDPADVFNDLDQLRAQNRKLDAEAERLVEMVKLAPPLDAAMLTPK